MKLLIISDTHHPSRSNIDFQNFLKSKDFDILIHCGDYDKLSTLIKLKNLVGSKFVGVYGNSDEYEIKNSLPEKMNMKLGKNNVMVIHGDQIYPRGDKSQLADIAISNNVKILFNGHTHRKSIIRYENGTYEEVQNIDMSNNSVYLVNPGNLMNGDYLEVEI